MGTVPLAVIIIERPLIFTCFVSVNCAYSFLFVLYKYMILDGCSLYVGQHN